MAELKKCPFCGGEAEVVKAHGAAMFPYTVVCKENECSASVGIFKETREKAIEAWNNRATEADIRASVINEFAEKMKWEIKNSIGISKRVADFTRAVVDMVSEQLKGE